MSFEVMDNPFLVIPEKKDLKYKEKIIDFATKLKDFVVNDEVTYKMITSIYGKARTCEKEVEIERKKIGEPLRKELARINDKAKEVSDPLSKIISICNEKSAGYITLLEEQNKEEQIKLREAEAMFSVSEPTYVEPVEKIIRGDGAMAITKVEKKFRLLDITKVPSKYLMLDESAIKKDLAMGFNKIEGLEIYEETKTSLRVR